MQKVPQAYRLSVPDAALADLNERLARTRWPDEPPLEPWSTGTSLPYLQGLVRYWRENFDWRAAEARLNAFPQFTVRVKGIDLHFIRAPGRRPDAMPLLLSHGWPGSVFEFLKLIPLLQENFTVIAPSLPGYGLSFKPGQPRFGTEDMAEAFAELMTGVLGYERYGCQGGDWGASIGTVLGYRYPDRVTGIHLNLLVVRRDPKLSADPKYTRQLNHFLREETGYQAIQGTKPQTLGYGLNDSPAGLAGWVAEKFHAWTDNDGTIESAVSRDDLLTNITTYWVTGTINSSTRLYYEAKKSGLFGPQGAKVEVPTAGAVFPREILRASRRFAERAYNVQHWSTFERGGHFAALEEPDLLIADIRAFGRVL